jgi:hypothetical protein
MLFLTMSMFAYHRDGSTKCAYGQSTDKPPNGELLPDARGCYLDDNADDKKDTFHDHSVSPSKHIGCAISGSTVKKKTEKDEYIKLTEHRPKRQRVFR